MDRCLAECFEELVECIAACGDSIECQTACLREQANCNNGQ